MKDIDTALRENAEHNGYVESEVEGHALCSTNRGFVSAEEALELPDALPDALFYDYYTNSYATSGQVDLGWLFLCREDASFSVDAARTAVYETALGSGRYYLSAFTQDKSAITAESVRWLVRISPRAKIAPYNMPSKS